MMARQSGEEAKPTDVMTASRGAGRKRAVQDPVEEDNQFKQQWLQLVSSK
jgi:hypothetical protein